MARWQPDAQGRLGAAALELYAERGYDQVTVAEIADRAGLTARTFFRYFADKREVLFAGSETLTDRLAESVDSAPDGQPPLTTVADALAVVATVIGDDLVHARRRQAVIVADPQLSERERSKLAAWSVTLAEKLQQTGVDEHTARLAAETGVAVFRVAYDRWLAGPDGPTLGRTLQDSFAQLATVTGPG